MPYPHTHTHTVHHAEWWGGGGGGGGGAMIPMHSDGVLHAYSGFCGDKQD